MAPPSQPPGKGPATPPKQPPAARSGPPVLGPKAGAAAPKAPPPSAKPPLPMVAGLAIEELAELERIHMTLAQSDYFEVLNLERTATPAEIKKAFYHWSRTFHPDRFYQLPDGELKQKVTAVYKRVTEAYYFLKDDRKRAKYLQDVSGPDRAAKLRFSEDAESETKAAVKKEQEEQIGAHPKGREFFKKGLLEFEGKRWANAERNFKMALTYEPQNARYKEKLEAAQKELHDEIKRTGGAFKIR